MQYLFKVIKVCCAVVIISLAASAFAAPAPVYDADTLPQQLENDQQGNQADSAYPYNRDQSNNGDDANVGDDQDQSMGPSSRQSAVTQPLTDNGFQSALQDNMPPPAAVATNANSAGFVPATSAMTMEQRMRQMEQQIGAMQGTDNAARLDALQNQLQALTGQVEQLMHQVEQMQLQQKNLPANIMAAPSITKTDKITSSRTKAKSETISSSANAMSANNQPNVAEEQQIYQTAYNYIKAKQYNDAVNSLQMMLKKYPQGQFAANAHYWLGELYGLLGKNDEALQEFTTVVNTHPESPRISDAQLKIGLILASQSRWGDAKSAFRKVVNKYPGTTSARLASDQLKQIKQAGH